MADDTKQIVDQSIGREMRRKWRQWSSAHDHGGPVAPSDTNDPAATHPDPDVEAARLRHPSAFGAGHIADCVQLPGTIPGPTADCPLPVEHLQGELAGYNDRRNGRPYLGDGGGPWHHGYRLGWGRCDHDMPGADDA